MKYLISYPRICIKLLDVRILSLSDSDIGLLTHLGHLLFTLYIRTYVLTFGYVTSRVFSFSSSTWYQSHNSSCCCHHHVALPLSFLVHCLLPLRRTLLSIFIFSHCRRQASVSSIVHALSVALLCLILRDVRRCVVYDPSHCLLLFFVCCFVAARSCTLFVASLRTMPLSHSCLIRKEVSR